MSRIITTIFRRTRRTSDGLVYFDGSRYVTI